MRGLRLMRLGVILMLVSYALELVLAVLWLQARTEADVLSALAWTGRLHLLSLVVVALLAAGVIGNLAELRRRRCSQTAAVVALVALLVSLTIRGWLYGLLRDVTTALEAGTMPARIDELALIPRRVFYGTASYAVGLIAIVRLLRQYALAVDNLGQREQARTLAGMLALLLLADTFYRFTYGLGSGDVGAFGVLGLCAALGVALFWVWCHRQLGRLIEHAMYTLHHSPEFPAAEVVAAPAPRRAPTAPSAPVAPPAPIVVPAAAPEVTAPASLSRGPRFLQDRAPTPSHHPAAGSTRGTHDHAPRSCIESSPARHVAGPDPRPGPGRMW